MQNCTTSKGCIENFRFFNLSKVLRLNIYSSSECCFYAIYNILETNHCGGGDLYDICVFVWVYVSSLKVMVMIWLSLRQRVEVTSSTHTHTYI